MKLLQTKTWLSSNASRKKFIAILLAYAISKKLNRREFEAVNESYIDLQNMDSDIADVIVYDIKNDLQPVLLIEICDNDSIKSTLTNLSVVAEIYNLRESFAYNITEAKWFHISEGAVSPTSQSDYFQFDLAVMLAA